MEGGGGELRSDALVLRVVDFAESDRVVTLLTPSNGKLGVMARGARKSRRRFAGALQVGQVLSVRIKPGRGSLGTLAEALVVRSFPGLAADLTRVACLGAALELVRELLPEGEADPWVFEETCRFLELLSLPARLPEEVLLSFHGRLLALVGFAPQVDTCGRSGRRAPFERSVFFDPRLGSMVSRDEGGGPIVLSPFARSVLRASTGEDWEGASSGWDPRDLATIHRALVDHTEHRLGKPLAASRMMSQFRELRR